MTLLRKNDPQEIVGIKRNEPFSSVQKIFCNCSNKSCYREDNKVSLKMIENQLMKVKGLGKQADVYVCRDGL